MLVAGDRDIKAGMVSVRLRTGENLGALDVEDFLAGVLPVLESRAPSDLGLGSASAERS